MVTTALLTFFTIHSVLKQSIMRQLFSYHLFNQSGGGDFRCLAFWQNHREKKTSKTPVKTVKLVLNWLGCFFNWLKLVSNWLVCFFNWFGWFGFLSTKRPKNNKTTETTRTLPFTRPCRCTPGKNGSKSLNMKITHGKFPTSAKKLEYGKLPT